MKRIENRLFPRYNIIHLKPLLHFPTIESANFIVKDISLGGIQIFAQNRIFLKSFNQVYFQLGDKSKIQLHLHQVWHEEIPHLDETYRNILKEDYETTQFRTGFRLKFIEEKYFLQWKRVIQAIHQHQKKKFNF